MADLLVSNVTFAPARTVDVGGGLLGFVGFQIGSALELSGVALRRTRSGEFALSFPLHKDRAGRRHRTVRVLTDDARTAIQAQVVGVLRQRGVLQ